MFIAVVSEGGEYPRQGSNTPGNSKGKPQDGGAGDAKGDVMTSNGTTMPRWDADLASVVNAWPHLPKAVKAGIVAMVRAARG